MTAPEWPSVPPGARYDVVGEMEIVFPPGDPFEQLAALPELAAGSIVAVTTGGVLADLRVEP